MRLVCFPYAGAGSTVFHAWPQGSPGNVEIYAAQLPARQERLQDAPLTRVDTIVECVAGELSRLPPMSTVLYGHSFGGLLAYEIARRLQAANAAPAALVIGARRAPHLPPAHAPIHHLPEADFLDAIHLRYGTPLAVLRSEVMALALRSLRADFEALETYAYVPGAPLESSVTVLRGRHDASVSADDAAAWQEVARGPIALHEIGAGHFFVDTHRAWVLERVFAIPAMSWQK
jgi:medium-chain acyl-[acyl-carrier-protein] hydrolase